NYKKEKRTKELKALEKSIAKIQKQQLEVQAVDEIEAKPVPLSSKVMLSQEDYKTLTTAAKKYVAQEKKESKLQRLLDAANRKITQLEKKVSDLLKSISELTKQLDQYRSVKGQLDKGKLQSENAELRKQNSTFKSIIEQHGLEHFLKRREEQRHGIIK
ncbi:MAG: plasmid recombination protein, partial [Eubacteriales bacterium]|nr:plasmid recombination protein [Eubacteriales bacterium]